VTRWRLPAVLGLTAVTLAAALVVGDYPIAVARVAEALRGIGSPRIRYVVLDLRLPRALVATVGGAALALAGAVFQRLARNPLASPDVIGISAGAGLGAVGALVLVAAGPAGVVGGAAGGALLAAVAVYRLSSRHGVTGPRLVLVGIAVGAVASALTSWLLTTADLYVAEQATVWLVGSLTGRSWSHAVPLVVSVPLLSLLVAAGVRRLRLLDLGDDTAGALGVRVERSRAGLLAVATLLAAAVTAVGGPIAFVALAAPQVARRLEGGRPPSLALSAACGATLLGLSDLVARRVAAPAEVPVGVVTAVCGAPLLIGLLIRARRRGESL
jgi:iron complex transport system permease protein